MTWRNRLGGGTVGSTQASRARAQARHESSRVLLLGLLVALVACGEEKACDPSSLFAPTEADCANFARGPWKVDLGADEFQMGDSRRARVSPGLPIECASQLASVAWSVEDPSVAIVTPVAAKNASNDTAADIARAWVTSLTPGTTRVKAQVSLSDGSTRDAEPATIQVVEPKAPPRKSFVVAEGTVTLTFNQFTGAGGADPIAVVLPRAGTVDITVDWSSFGTTIDFSLWEGLCDRTATCSGRQVVHAQLLSVKPRREAAPNLAAGEYTFFIGGVGRAPEEVRYEVRLTPD